MDYKELNAYILRHHRIVHRITVWTSWRVLDMESIEIMLQLADSGALKLEKDFLNDNSYLWELYLDIRENKEAYLINDMVYIAKKIKELNLKYDNIYHI